MSTSGPEPTWPSPPPAETDPLTRAAQRRAEGHRLDAKVLDRRRTVEHASSELAEAEHRRTRERADVERLEKMTWHWMVTSLKGETAAELEREQQEAQQAEYAVAVAAQRLEISETELRDAESRRAALGDVEGDYRRELAAQENELRAAGGDTAEELSQLSLRQGQLRDRAREIDEATHAGRTALEGLISAHGSLDSARSWSTWDTFGGGGLVTDMIKHDHLEQSRMAMHRADAAMRHFDRELADLNLANIQHVDAVVDSRFSDWFFDGIFTDLRVRDRIITAAQQLLNTIRQVEMVLARLGESRTQLDQDWQAISAERERLLTAGSLDRGEY